MTEAPPTRFLELAEGRIAYDDTGGDGQLVLCIPGMGDLRTQFRFLRPRLVDAGYRVMTMDLRGTGESSADFSDYTPAWVADDAAELLRANIGAVPAVIVANSLAAASSIRLAAEFPSLVWSIVMLGPVARDPVPSVWRSAAYHVVVDSAFLGPWGPPAWGAYYRSLYPSWESRHVPADLDEHVAAIERSLAEPGRLHALRRFALASKADCTEHIGQVEASVLAVVGSLDPDVADPAAELAWLAEAAGARTLLLDGIGHYPHVEDPDRTAPAVLDFLADALRSPPPRPAASLARDVEGPSAPSGAPHIQMEDTW